MNDKKSLINRPRKGVIKMKVIHPGDRFGRLVVLRETTKEERRNKGGRNYWCRCDCGKEVIVYGNHLKQGYTKSCGCLNKELASTRNSVEIPTGTKYGQLTVLERAPVHPGKNLAYWKCQCDCGNIVEVSGSDLRSGHRTTCGSPFHNSINEIGNKYGMLTVIEYAGSNEQGTHRTALWNCRCDCGRYIIARGESLRAGKITSCGCINSYPEKVIADLLDQEGISYSRQYTFNDLVSDKNGKLRFDFAIFDENHNLRCLIEYQGQQHYDEDNNWYSEDAVKRDWQKQEYCKQHNIPLYCIDKNTNLEEFIKQLAEGVV
jgi:hypothetical protein